MKLSRLIDLAYRCEYAGLEELEVLQEFAHTWQDLLDAQLEDLHLSRLDLEEQESDYLSIGGVKL